jgi:hypothetical protein
MKRIEFMKGFAMLLALLTVTEVCAQTRRKTTTTTRKATTTTTTTAKTAAKSNVIKTIACYTGAEVKSYAIGNKYIYYVENNNNNAIIGINRQTGERETIIPGIAGIYEGARMRIQEVHASGDKLFLIAIDRKKEYHVYLYDGKSFESSTYLKDWGYIIKCSNKAAFIIDQAETFELWDTETMKKIANYGKLQILSPWYDNPNVYIASDNAVWYTGSNRNTIRGSKLNRLETNGKVTNYDLSKESYLVQNDYNSVFGQIFQSGDTIYAPYSRRVYRMNMLSPGKWEEYAKIPVNEYKTFDRVWVDSKGNFLTKGESYADYNIEYYRADALDSPKAMGKSAFKTGFPYDLSTWGHQEIYPSLYLIRVDDKDNFILRGDATIYIYNPNGIVGYTKAIGKIIK